MKVVQSALVAAFRLVHDAALDTIFASTTTTWAFAADAATFINQKNSGVT
jgi:hypothetical protein